MGMEVSIQQRRLIHKTAVLSKMMEIILLLRIMTGLAWAHILEEIGLLSFRLFRGKNFPHYLKLNIVKVLKYPIVNIKD